MVKFADDFTATINGEPVRGRTTLKVINPATETVIAEAPDCGSEELDAAVECGARRIRDLAGDTAVCAAGRGKDARGTHS